MRTDSVFDDFKIISLSKETSIFIAVSSLFLICIFPPLFCSGLSLLGFTVDWINRENYYQHWLDQDGLRVDFSAYETKDDVRQALLSSLPVGTSEEELIEFYYANTLSRIHKSAWKPDNIESFCRSRKFLGFDCKYGVIFRVNVTEGGHIFQRNLFNNQYVIVFELDPETHNLKDINVMFRGWEAGWNF